MAYGIVNVPSVSGPEFEAVRSIVSGGIALAYSDSKSYAIGDYCNKDGKFYKCTVAITFGEEWTPAHWIETVIPDELKELQASVKTNSERIQTLINQVNTSFIITVKFAPEFEGATYTATGDGATRTGVVPNTLAARIYVDNANTTYTISAQANGETFTDTVTTGKYYGEYGVTLTAFRATLNVTTVAGTTVTVKNSERTYVETADESGIASFIIHKAGTYNISSTNSVRNGTANANVTTHAGTFAATARLNISTVPTQSTIPTYTGNSLSPSWNNFDSSELALGGTTNGTNAGNYTATFTPKTGYQWSDGSITAKSVTWSIGKASGSLSLNKSSLSLSGSSPTGTITVTRAGDGTITATSSDTSVATVSVSGTTVTVTGKKDGSATITVKVAAGTNHNAPSNKTCSVSISNMTVTLPAQSGSLTYTGSALSPSWDSNYSSAKFTVSGTTSGTNAGTYTATFTPKSGYKWSDGTQTSKNVNWIIGKAAGSLSLSPTSLSMDGTSTKTITVTRAGNGTITATSNSTGVAKVSLSGTTITVTAVSDGSATITVSVAAGTNHKAPSNKTCSVNVVMKMTASTSAKSGVTYTNGIGNLSFAILKEIAHAISNNSSITKTTSVVYCDSSTVHRKISIGDNASIAFGSETVYMRVVAFNHYKLSNSTNYGSATATGKAGIALQSVDCLKTKYAMHSANNNSGGWANMALRTTMRETIKSSLHTTLQNIIAPVDILASIGDSATNVTTLTNETLFLLSEMEIHNSSYQIVGEGERLAWYKANTDASYRIKKSERYRESLVD